MRKLLFTALALLAGMALAPAHAADIILEKAWARASVGTSGASAAYVMVRNPGASPDRILAAAAPVAKRVELHTHIMEGGTAKMRQVDGIDVPAGGMAMLEPGGHHVMLMGLTTALIEGESFPLTLTFERAGPVTVDVPIQAPGATGHGGHKHGGHKHGGQKKGG